MTGRARRDTVPSRPGPGPRRTPARTGHARSKGTKPMGIIAWIVVGAIAGFIATLIMGTREGIVMTIILGIVGALVGGFLAGVFLNVKDPTGINVETCLLYTSDAADE